jgi:hypothetical protein
MLLPLLRTRTPNVISQDCCHLKQPFESQDSSYKAVPGTEAPSDGKITRPTRVSNHQLFAEKNKSEF